MLEVNYDPFLVAASILVAIMASFTCLRLSSGMRDLTVAARKPRIAQAAIALGGGIWSMHFIGMLSINIPVQMRYDALPTLGSVLIAILVVGTAFLFLHIGVRTQSRIIVAGILTGLGIVSMHYLGMSAISGNCILFYDTTGVLVATGIGIGAAILALELAYRRRSMGTTILGAVVLGLAISAMHYSAMLFTTFSLADTIVPVSAPNISQGTLAMIVAVASFVICGLFLLIAVPATEQFSQVVIEAQKSAETDKERPGNSLDAPAVDETDHQSATLDTLIPGDAVKKPPNLALSKAMSEPRQAESKESVSDKPVRIPYERDSAIRFLMADAISYVQADGHYCRIQDGKLEYFCPWPISRVEKSVADGDFIRTHRSFLVNITKVKGFRRNGDKAWCLFGEAEDIEVPVSRTRIAEVQTALGLT
ncbi:MAG: MHYT domain-containing protein [Stappiaceae bacterium]